MDALTFYTASLANSLHDLINTQLWTLPKSQEFRVQSAIMALIVTLGLLSYQVGVLTQPTEAAAVEQPQIEEGKAASELAMTFVRDEYFNNTDGDLLFLERRGEPHTPHTPPPNAGHEVLSAVLVTPSLSLSSFSSSSSSTPTRVPKKSPSTPTKRHSTPDTGSSPSQNLRSQCEDEQCRRTRGVKMEGEKGVG
ncbi:hypothetical protein MMC21_005260 [Puttea exsequens]|nr:hypothetical protein [Puttea exsequens]